MVAEPQDVESRGVRGRRTRRRCDQSRSGRLVIMVQIVSWCAVGALLILRGVTTLTTDVEYSPVNNTTSTDDIKESSQRDGAPEEETTAHQNATAVPKRASLPHTVRIAPKINPSSAILITVGTTMLVIGPTLLLARILDSRRIERDGVKFSKVDPPPSYDEVVDKAPRYSSLFQVTESGELVPISCIENPTSINMADTDTSSNSNFLNVPV